MDIRHAARQMLKAAGVRRAELSIIFLDGGAIRRLNRDFLGHDFVTDVVTFDLREPAGAHVTRAQEHKGNRGRRVLLCSLACRPGQACAPVTIDGEIYICPAEARRNARLYGEPLKRELLRYLAHGILHLLGWDDVTMAKRDRMRCLEDKLLVATDH
jgi:probable rRNA maturation factor